MACWRKRGCAAECHRRQADPDRHERAAHCAAGVHFRGGTGGPEIRPIAAFYGPGDAFELPAAFEDPRDELRVATHLLLALGEEQQALRGGFTLTPQATKQTAFAFRMPSAWQLQRGTVPTSNPLAYDRYPLDSDTRYVVTLPAAIEPGTSVTIYFEASYRSSAWLGRWTPRTSSSRASRWNRRPTPRAPRGAAHRRLDRQTTDRSKA